MKKSSLSGLFREMLGEMAGRLQHLDQRIHEYDSKMERVFGQDERCRRLAKVEGVGPLTATALVAAVGNAHEFTSGRELSAWLGLVPRQHSSGGRNLLLNISKRGDRYLVLCSFKEPVPRCAQSSGARIDAAFQYPG